MDTLTVACVLRKSPDFDEEYVERLHAGVAANLKGDYRFVCISDVPVSCERIEMQNTWPKWWCKMDVFLLPPPVLCFDLDTIILGDLTDIAAQARKPKLTMMRDVYRPAGLQGSMMAWGIDMSHLYNQFAMQPEAIMASVRDDQQLIECNEDWSRIEKWQDVLPGQVVSYKVHVKDKGIPANARVCIFHGQPRPRDTEMWR